MKKIKKRKLMINFLFYGCILLMIISIGICYYFTELLDPRIKINNFISILSIILFFGFAILFFYLLWKYEFAFEEDEAHHFEGSFKYKINYKEFLVIYKLLKESLLKNNYELVIENKINENEFVHIYKKSNGLLLEYFLVANFKVFKNNQKKILTKVLEDFLNKVKNNEKEIKSIFLINVETYSKTLETFINHTTESNGNIINFSMAFINGINLIYLGKNQYFDEGKYYEQKIQEILPFEYKEISPSRKFIVKVIATILVIVIFALSFLILGNFLKEKHKFRFGYIIHTTIAENCDKTLDYYTTLKDGKVVNTYCLKQIVLETKDNFYDFKSVLNEHNEIIEDIITILPDKVKYQNGNILYKQEALEDYFAYEGLGIIVTKDGYILTNGRI